MRSRVISLVAPFAIVAGITGLVYSQQQEASDAPNGDPARLFVGQSLAELKSLLTIRKIEFGEGGFALGNLDPDTSFLSVKLDRNHASACVFFSKTRMEVTRLRTVFFPARKRSYKANQSWLSATEISLYDDGSYAVRFPPPISEEELKELEAIVPHDEKPKDEEPSRPTRRPKPADDPFDKRLDDPPGKGR